VCGGKNRQVGLAGSDQCGQGAYRGLPVGTAQLSVFSRLAKLSGTLRVVYNDVRLWGVERIWRVSSRLESPFYGLGITLIAPLMQSEAGERQ
jgi:hypothetical protein